MHAVLPEVPLVVFTDRGVSPLGRWRARIENGIRLLRATDLGAIRPTTWPLAARTRASTSAARDRCSCAASATCSNRAGIYSARSRRSSVAGARCRAHRLLRATAAEDGRRVVVVGPGRRQVRSGRSWSSGAPPARSGRGAVRRRDSVGAGSPFAMLGRDPAGGRHPRREPIEACRSKLCERVGRHVDRRPPRGSRAPGGRNPPRGSQRRAAGSRGSALPMGDAAPASRLAGGRDGGPPGGDRARGSAVDDPAPSAYRRCAPPPARRASDVLALARTS
jgi:hypothetical protein